uniref:U96-Liphistoxin-Lth1a_1 n=1 Tax=Liphistius thaleban TaxID=1905330 RepID=A0A4V6MK85_9ARAC
MHILTSTMLMMSVFQLCELHVMSSLPSEGHRFTKVCPGNTLLCCSCMLFYPPVLTICYIHSTCLLPVISLHIVSVVNPCYRPALSSSMPICIILWWFLFGMALSMTSVFITLWTTSDLQVQILTI